MTALAMARASMLRLLRDRTALFFMVILPIAVILLIGATVSGFDTLRVGVVAGGDGPLARDLEAALDGEPSLRVAAYEDETRLRTDLRRGIVDAGVLIPPALDDDLAAGEHVLVTVLADQANNGQVAALAAVQGVVADHATRIQAALYASDQVGGSLDANLARADEAAEVVPILETAVVAVDASSNILPEGFSYSAPTMLVLFVFITALAAGAQMIDTRKLGIYERMLAGPVTSGAIVMGETAVYFAISLVQSLLIVVVGATFFGVQWGDPVAAAALVATWALVGTGAGMLAGTLFRTPEQAGSIGPPIGILFGMLGGCMWPLEIVPPTVRTLGHAVPHAWAVDAWTELLSRGGTLADIAPMLSVLGGFAIVVLGTAVLRFRRLLDR